MDSYTALANNSSGLSPVTIYPLSALFCVLIDFPKNQSDCSTTTPICATCTFTSAFFTGESVNDFGGISHLILILLWILTLIFGITATITNTLIILILRRRLKKAFNILLLVLATFDLICCIGAVVGTTGFILFLANWTGRGHVPLILHVWFGFVALVGRSGSNLTTVLITFERFLVIRFPLRLSLRLTPGKAKFLGCSVLIVSLVLNLFWAAGVSITPNQVQQEIASLAPFSYVVKTSFNKGWYYHYFSPWRETVDTWAPLPVLIIFNLASYWTVSKSLRKRKEMNVQLQKDHYAVEMFLPVVGVFFLSNIIPFGFVGALRITGYAYRELYIGSYLSIVFAAALNLPIYYFKWETLERN